MTHFFKKKTSSNLTIPESSITIYLNRPKLLQPLFVLFRFVSGDREIHSVCVPPTLRRPEHDVRGLYVLVRHRRRRLCVGRNVRRICRRMDGKQFRKVGTSLFRLYWSSRCCRVTRCLDYVFNFGHLQR